MKAIALSGLLIFVGATSALAGDYTIKGKIGSYSAPAKVFVEIDGRNLEAAVNEGRFELKGTVDNPQMVFMLFSPSGEISKDGLQTLDLYLEPGTIVIEGSSLSDATVSGTANNEIFSRLMKSLPARNPADRQASRQAREKALREFIAAHPDSPISIQAIKMLAGYAPDPDVAEPLLLGLSPTVRATLDGADYASLLQSRRSVQPGRMAPDFAKLDPSGKTIRLSELRGKYVLLDFWGSWCGPCRASHPHLKELYAKYKAHGFEIVGIAAEHQELSASREKWLKAIAEDGLPWMNVLNDQDKEGFDAVKAYGITAYPTKILLDKEGKIVASVGMGDALDKLLGKIFGE